MAEPNANLARARELRAAHPEWSLRMISAALYHGEGSPQFLAAKWQATTFLARFRATEGWMR